MSFQQLAEIIMPFLGVFGVGGMVLLAMKMRYDFKARLHGGRDRSVDELRDAVQELREEVQSLHGGLAELYERVEFTERMLTRSNAPKDRPDHVATPV
ncbi:MAG: hypothetical protein ACE5HT_06490 [Gemmatimonadales bacterium]